LVVTNFPLTARRPGGEIGLRTPFFRRGAPVMSPRRRGWMALAALLAAGLALGGLQPTASAPPRGKKEAKGEGKPKPGGVRLPDKLTSDGGPPFTPVETGGKRYLIFHFEFLTEEDCKACVALEGVHALTRHGKFCDVMIAEDKLSEVNKRLRNLFAWDFNR